LLFSIVKNTEILTVDNEIVHPCHIVTG